MLSLQVSIGALNDLVDAPRDAGQKPGKPIPRAAATRAEARAIAVAGLVVAVALTLPSHPATLAVLAVGAACGYAYDLRLSRTAISWLPLAIALPMVPLFAWLGSTGALPPAIAPVVPAGILAGTGLALANGLADLERDRATGAATAVVRLGSGRAWAIQASALGLAVGVLGAALLSGSDLRPATTGITVLLIGTGIVALGVGIALGRSGGAARRERAWELEAIAIALVAAGWFGSIGTPR